MASDPTNIGADPLIPKWLFSTPATEISSSTNFSDSLINQTRKMHNNSLQIHEYPQTFVIPMTIVLSIVMVMAFVGNSMTLITLWRHQRMRTRTNMFIANLAIADVMVSIFDMPVAMITLVQGRWIFPDAVCYINGFTVGLGFMLSIHTLMWIR
jgi:hypothetical protein